MIPTANRSAVHYTSHMKPPAQFGWDQFFNGLVCFWAGTATEPTEPIAYSCDVGVNGKDFKTQGEHQDALGSLDTDTWKAEKESHRVCFFHLPQPS